MQSENYKTKKKKKKKKLTGENLSCLRFGSELLDVTSKL